MVHRKENSLLIPYKVKDNQIFVFLQKRDSFAKVLPSHFSFFGGKIEEGETKEQALLREIKEELNIDLGSHDFLGVYNSPVKEELVLNVYYKKVDDDFEDKIKIGEGEYGKFFSEQEMADEPKLIDSDKQIIKDFYERVR